MYRLKGGGIRARGLRSHKVQRRCSKIEITRSIEEVDSPSTYVGDVVTNIEGVAMAELT